MSVIEYHSKSQEEMDFIVSENTTITMACEQKEPDTEPKINDKRDIDQIPTIFPCISCNSIFIKREECREHMREHARNKTLKCRYCDEGQRNMKQLLFHLKMHSSESSGDSNQLATSNNTSKVIQKRKQNKEGLKCTETKQGNRERKKDSCTFSQKCTDCSEVFVSKISLKTHMKLHNVGKLLYSCGHCSYRSDFPTAIKKHLSKKHRNLTMLYKCSICKYVAIRVSMLKTHVTKKHLEI